MKYGMIDENSWLDISSSQIAHAWKDFEPLIIVARRRGGLAVFENFEYAAVRAELWMRRSPDGNYPKGLPRMDQLKSVGGAQRSR